MQHDLYDLLQAAKSDAPPARYTVDDAVAAGRRRQGRRRVALTGAASFAVVAAVAGAVVLPQALAGRTPGRPDVAAATGATTKAAADVPFTYPAGDFQFGFRGYTVGKYRVTDPVLVAPNFQQADIRVGNETETMYGSDSAADEKATEDKKNGRPFKSGERKASPDDVTGPKFALKLTVYRPKAFSPERFRTFKAEPVTVAGRPGYFSTDMPIDRDPSGGEGLKWPALAWQYADDAWAVIDNVTPDQHGKRDLMSIAAGLRGADAYPASIVFETTYLPEGYRLASGGRGADWPNGGGWAQITGTRYVHGAGSAAGTTTMPVLDPEDSTERDLRINVYDRKWATNSQPPKGQPEDAVWCNSGNAQLCYRLLPGGKYVAEVQGSGQESTADLRKVMAGLRFADVDDPAAWFPMT
ncbi:hypothetical protein [Jidongwangia harbinensis]|uniref:hypothetical protein n=1 Tax=Jidongwangia harbinensis TaxID=2878561 RepID=UPI001CDA33E5|nr:hypothetical protein [Jidongwangia harbinensis]MCA2214635.1 hypothetical protein [Jidongwangia harbinensis]